MNTQELEKYITKEIAAYQLSGEEYRFRCLICGKNHKAGSRKTLSKCLSKLEKARHFHDLYAPYVEGIQFYCGMSEASIHFTEMIINILLPGIPLRALYQKTDRIIDFLKDFYMSTGNKKDNYVYINNNRIYFNYRNKLTEQNPCLLLMENYNKYLAIEYKKILHKKIKLFKNIILNIAQVMRCHADLFIDETQPRDDSFLPNVADHCIKIESIAEKTKKLIQIETGKTYYHDDISNLISQLILAYYRDYDNEMAQPYEYRTIDDEINTIRDVRSYASFYNYGKICAQSNKNHKNQNLRIIVTSKSREYNEELQALTEEIAEQLLPIEQMAEYMMEYTKKENKRQGGQKKHSSCQLSLDIPY